MEEMLHSLMRNDRIPDVDANISLIIHIATSTDNVILSNRLEIVSKITFITLKNIYSNNWDNFINILEENDQKLFVNINNYKIFISNKWLFQVLLLSSIKNVDNASMNRFDTTFLNKIINYIVEYIRMVEKHSLHLLRTLQFILLKRYDVLTPTLSLKLLKWMNIVALSPITGFRSYAQGISKICLNSLTVENQQHLCNINILPIRNIDTYDLMTLFSRKFIQLNIVKVINRIIKSFYSNIENKDGGIFYGKLLSVYSFEEWTIRIWPLLLKHVTKVDNDGEFFQSLIKYWIPYNINVYRNMFYLFIRDQPIDPIIKGYALLETRKKGFSVDLNLTSDISTVFCHPRTVNIALQIISSFYKKSICPTMFEFKLVTEFLYTNIDMFLAEEQMKSLKLFFSQMFLYSHNDLKKSEENFHFYDEVVEKIYNFCSVTLKVEFYEVGAQILDIVLGILKGSHKDLTLLYKLEQRDFYHATQNNLFCTLQTKSKWKFEDTVFLTILKNCFFKNAGSSRILTDVIVKYYAHYDLIGVDDMRFLFESSGSTTLKNVEKLANFSIVLLKNINIDKEALIQEINYKLQENLSVNSVMDEKTIFDNIVYLEFMSTSVQIYSKLFDFNSLLKKCVVYIDSVLEIDLSTIDGFQPKKVLETFINTVINCIIRNINIVMLDMDKWYIMEILIKIIEVSNMKKSVTLSAEALKQMSSKMHNHSDVNLKLQLLDDTLRAVRDTSIKSTLKIRRNPESRLVIHALCLSDKNPDKLLLRWIMHFLFELILNKSTSDIAIARSLHCLEILVLDNALQYQTLQYTEKIIKLCVELFIKTNWIIRNADLQLAKALIDRFFGVSLSFSDRLKNIEDLFVVFPELMPYFFNILASEELDERSIMVFQFFFESEIKEQPWHNGITECLYGFQRLFIDIIKRYPNNYGNLAVRSFVAICNVRYIPGVCSDISDYVKCNYFAINKNIFANFVSLLQKLYDKYMNSPESHNIREIDFYLKDLISFLANCNNNLFDFLLFKTETCHDILNAISGKNCEANYEDRLWLHNNLPYLVNHTSIDEIYKILDVLLSENIPICLRVKVLSILIVRFEKGHLTAKNIQNILGVIFMKSLTGEENKYLLICYYKIIVLLCQNIEGINVFKDYNFYSSNLYKTMIFVIYLYLTKNSSLKNRSTLSKHIESIYLKSVGINEEIDNDIISSLICYIKISPNNLHSNFYKMIFHYSLYYSTYQETYNCISSTSNKSFCSILAAIKEFLLRVSSDVKVNKNDKEVFFLELIKYVDNEYKDFEDSDGFYAKERDNVVPKFFLRKLLLYVGGR